jgi:Protein of unknown function (DUF3887)
MASVAEPGVCQSCGRPLPNQQGPGRRRRYCNELCRDRARRDRERSARHPAPVVKRSLTYWGRHGNLDVDESMPGASDAVAVEVAEAVRRLLAELERPQSPAAAVGAARDLLDAAEAALQAAVDRARAAGQSWRDIGDVLGTSRQAAFQRFGHPVDPRTGAPVTRTVASGAIERAMEFLACFTAGRWDEALGYLDDRMRERHDTVRLASGWSQMTGMFGSFEGLGEVAPVAVGDSTVVDVVLRFEAGEAMVWVRFDHDGRVSGLRLHPAAS